MFTSNQYSYVRGPLRECRSIRSGASRVPYYCVPLVCVSDVMELLPMWWHNKPKTKAMRLVQWLGWVFETQERRKKRPRGWAVDLTWSLGKKMCEPFLSLTEPKIKFNVLYCVTPNKIDPSYMVCVKKFVALFQHYSLSSCPLPLRVSLDGKFSKVVIFSITLVLIRKTNVCNKVASRLGLSFRGGSET